MRRTIRDRNKNYRVIGRVSIGAVNVLLWDRGKEEKEIQDQNVFIVLGSLDRMEVKRYRCTLSPS